MQGEGGAEGVGSAARAGYWVELTGSENEAPLFVEGRVVGAEEARGRKRKQEEARGSKRTQEAHLWAAPPSCSACARWYSSCPLHALQQA